MTDDKPKAYAPKAPKEAEWLDRKYRRIAMPYTRRIDARPIIVSKLSRREMEALVYYFSQLETVKLEEDGTNPVDKLRDMFDKECKRRCEERKENLKTALFCLIPVCLLLVLCKLFF